MGLDKLIDSARLDGALSATATAILSKTGGSTPLTWDMDEGFADVIEDIPTQAAQTITPTTSNQTISSGTFLTGDQTILGDTNLVASNIASGINIFGVVGTFQGGGGGDDLKNFIEQHNTISNFTDSTISSIGSGAFAHCGGLTMVSIPACTFISAYAFQQCGSLASANFSLCTQIGSNAFTGCSYLQSADFPACTYMGSYAFSVCSRLRTISFPMCSYINGYAFTSCWILQTASFPSCANILSYAFQKCFSLVSLYLTGSSVARLWNSNAFSSTPIAGYTTSTGGVYGSIFVPSSLYSTYIASTNWTYFSSRFVSV